MRSPGQPAETGVADSRRTAARLPLSVLLLVGVALGIGTATGIVPGLGSAPAAAHTDLLQASPGPGQRAGGDIDFVDLAFLEPVSGATVDVVHDGETVPGSMIVTDGSIIRFAFDEPLTSSGTYEVSYAMTSYDLDATTGSFSFTFEPEAPQARRIGTIEESGRNWTQIVATGVLIVALAGAAFLFLSRVESKRRAPGSSERDDRQVDR
jgi:methionine-rich copper-binding protein CopC